MTEPVKIGISSCLLGEKVRYDGGHRYDRYLAGTLGGACAFTGVCPETGCGLPTPREAMRLEGDPQAPRLITRKTRVDLTGQLLAWCRSRLPEPDVAKLCGFIFKTRSPSCGLFRVKVYQPGIPPRSGRGLFADALLGRFPLLPVEEDERLHHPANRENFITRVLTYRRWRHFMGSRPGIGNLVEFHAVHKLLIMAHSPVQYREMGKLVANGEDSALGDLLPRYGELLMRALSRHATVSKNVNVLLHIMGYFKKQLSSRQKEELLEVIGRYRHRQVPLDVPLTLLRHHADNHGQRYLQKQLYLNPDPVRLLPPPPECDKPP